MEILLWLLIIYGYIASIVILSNIADWRYYKPIYKVFKQALVTNKSYGILQRYTKTEVLWFNDESFKLKSGVYLDKCFVWFDLYSLYWWIKFTKEVRRKQIK